MPTKRIKANGGHNALWIQWLEEEKLGLSRRYRQNLDKAKRALRDHPIPLTNPEDLLQLKYFGPAIVKKIKKRTRDDPIAKAAGSSSGPPPNQQARVSMVDETNELINGPIPALAGLYQPTYLAPDAYNHIQEQPEQPIRLPQSLVFTYCDQAQKPVSQQSLAAVEVHERQGILLYAILFRADNLALAQAAGIGRIESARSEQFTDIPQTYHGYLPETNELALRVIQSSTLPPLKSRIRTADPIRTLPPHAGQLTDPRQRNASTSSMAANAARAALQRAQALATGSLASGAPMDEDVLSNSSHVDILTSENLQYQPPDVSTDFSFIKWPARTYDVICLIDSREIKDQKSRDYIVQELTLMGVRVERRSLQLGDMLWIARRRPGFRDQDVRNGTLNSGEVALDFIVERKRIDDLVASVKGDRFYEQKSRLRKCGVANVFYVIETSGKGRTQEVKSFEDAINTVISSTQVVDGFFVHQTVDTMATVQLLKILHESVCDKYKDEDLYVIPQEQVHRDTYHALRQQLAEHKPNISIVTLYESFNLINAKYTFTTARECFARQLLCIRGMTPERVSFVVDQYGTLRGLWEAFREAEAQEEILLRLEAENATNNGKKGKGKSQVPKAELMLAEVGPTYRKIGKELSKKVYRLFTDDVYTDGDSE